MNMHSPTPVSPPGEIPGQFPNPGRDPVPDKPVDPTPDQPIDPTPDRPIDPTPDRPIDPDPGRPIDPDPGRTNEPLKLPGEPSSLGQGEPVSQSGTGAMA